MSTTFGRIGRGFLLGAAACAVAAAVAWLLLTGVARPVTAGVLAVLALVAVVQCVVWTVAQRRLFGPPSVLARVAATGRQTGAVLTAVRGAAGRIGGDRVLRLAVTVDGAAREHAVLVPAGRAEAVRPGVVLPVRVDRAHPRVLVVEWDRVR